MCWAGCGRTNHCLRLPIARSSSAFCCRSWLCCPSCCARAADSTPRSMRKVYMKPAWLQVHSFFLGWWVEFSILYFICFCCGGARTWSVCTLSEQGDARSRKMTSTGKTRPEANLRLSGVRVNWQLKTVLPVAFVLVNGIVLFMLATVSLRDPERHQVLIVAGVGAIAVC